MVHTVFFWLKDDQREAVAAEFKTALDALSKIDLIQRAHVGVPAATEPRPVTDHSWDYNIQFEFKNQADHDAYQVHPDHDVFVEKCKGWWQKVVVYDSE